METKDYKVVLIYEDGSRDAVTVTADDLATVMKISRGWLLTSSSAVMVRYYQVDKPSVEGTYIREPER